MLKTEDKSSGLEALAEIGVESRTYFRAVLACLTSEEANVYENALVAATKIAGDDKLLRTEATAAIAKSIQMHMKNPRHLSDKLITHAAAQLALLGIPNKAACEELFLHIKDDKSGSYDNKIVCAEAIAIMYPNHELAARYFAKLALDKNRSTAEFGKTCVEFFCPRKLGKTVDDHLVWLQSDHLETKNLNLRRKLIALRHLEDYPESRESYQKYVQRISSDHPHPVLRRFAAELLAGGSPSSVELRP